MVQPVPLTAKNLEERPLLVDTMKDVSRRQLKMLKEMKEERARKSTLSGVALNSC